jgi:hypothetical protein
VEVGGRGWLEEVFGTNRLNLKREGLRHIDNFFTLTVHFLHVDEFHTRLLNFRLLLIVVIEVADIFDRLLRICAVDVRH